MTAPAHQCQPRIRDALAGIFGLILTALILGLPLSGALYDAFQRMIQ